MIHLGAGLDNGGRSADICALLRGNTLGQRLVCQTSVGSCDHDITEVNVAGGRKHIDVILSALDGRSAGDVISVLVEYGLHDVICIIIIVAVLRSLILNQVQDILVALEVVVHGLDEFLHGELLVVIYVVLDGCKCIGDGSDTNTLDVVGVVSCAACIVVLALLDAVVGADGKERSRHLFCVDLLDNQVAAHLHVDNVLQLLLEGLEELLIRLVILRMSGVQTNLLLEHRIPAVIECQLQALRNIQISGKDVSLGSPCAGLNTAGASGIAGIHQGLACVQKLLDELVGIVECRLAPALTCNLAGSLEELVRSLLGNLYVGVRLVLTHILHAVQNQVGNFVYAVGAVLGHTAGVDVCKVNVGTGLLQGNTDLNRCRGVEQLNPQAFQKLESSGVVQGAVCGIFSVERNQVLVKTSRCECIPRIQLGGNAQVCEPVHLQCLPVGLRLVLRNNGAVGSDLLKLSLADRIGALCSSLQCQVMISLAQDHDGVAVNLHGAELLLLVISFRIIEVIQLCDGFLDFLLVVAVALDVEVLAACGMARASLLHELGEHTDLIAVSPLLGHGLQDVLADSSVLPVRDNNLLLNVQLLLGNGEVNQLSVIHDMHVFQSVAAKLRECRGALRVYALLAYQKLIIAQIQGLSGEILLQNQSSQNRNGNCALVLLINFGLNNGSLQIQMGLGGMADSSQSLDSLGATALVVLQQTLRGIDVKGSIDSLCHGNHPPIKTFVNPCSSNMVLKCSISSLSGFTIDASS